MSQQEQWEVVCKKCSHISIFDSEPPEDYECGLCGPPPTETKYSKDYKIIIAPKLWRCGNHHQTFKYGKNCPECQEKYLAPTFKILKQSQPDKTYENFRDEIEMNKSEGGIIKKIRERQMAIQQAQLDTPVLLKQLIGKMDKLVKVMEDK